MPNCRDTPGWRMSTASTSSLTERSPPRSASTSRRRVGSARIWNMSGMATYYPSDICFVNDISASRPRTTRVRPGLAAELERLAYHPRDGRPFSVGGGAQRGESGLLAAALQQAASVVELTAPVEDQGRVRAKVADPNADPAADGGADKL